MSNIARGVDGSDAANMEQLSATNSELRFFKLALASMMGAGAAVDEPDTGIIWRSPIFNTTDISPTGAPSAARSATVDQALTRINTSVINVAALGVKYDDVSTKERVTFNAGSTSTTLANVKAGDLSAASTEAVNGSQLNATNTTVTGLGTQLGNLISSSGSQNQNLANALGGGAKLNATTGEWTAPTFNTTAISATGTTSAAPTAKIGDALTSLNTSLINVAAAGIKYDDVATKERVTFNAGGTSTTLANVKAGDLSATSTEAVNGSQLNATNTNVAGLSTQLGNIVNSGAGIKYFHANSTKADSTASGTDAMALGPKAVASGNSAIALGNDAAASGIGSVAIGDGAKALANGSAALGKGASDDNRGSETYVGKYSQVSNATTGVVSVGNEATGETRVLSNVADGNNATDAVNLRQLDGAVAESKAYTNSSLNQVQSSIKEVSGAVTSLNSNVAKVEAAVSSVQKGTSGAFQVNNTRNAPQPQASGSNAVAGGMGSQASGENSVAVGSNAQASAKNATATGNDAKATANNSVALGSNSVADRENSVAVGHVGNERQVSHVAAGSRATDAVNVDQLNRSVANITSNANAHTEQRFGELRRDLKQQDNVLSAGIAGAMAMASLPRSSSAGGSMTSVAMGHYRGQTALGVGVSHLSANGRWSTNLMGTTSNQNDTGAAVGAGYQW